MAYLSVFIVVMFSMSHTYVYNFSVFLASRFNATIWQQFKICHVMNEFYECLYYRVLQLNHCLVMLHN